ncbi:hypothetical protein FNV43_RR02616 [Rhamnella rubrinervis]|uniref:Gem-associated protein 2 n=1 Tax=Rhamnella rubrinervis TaxID=2594499 RepID=A0A8K0MTU3_9ROSA|nr:hypothetical protein FNV43_RR02616 [Rhamnella rubrinervis]
MEEITHCSVSDSSANTFHSKNAESSPHGESSDTHVKAGDEIPDPGDRKSLGCELVSGFSESGGTNEGFPRNCEVGFVSDVGSAKTQMENSENNEKESSLISDLVEKEEKDPVKCEVGLTGIQEFEEFNTGVSKKLPVKVENSANQAGSEEFLAGSSFSVDDKVLLGKPVESESSLEVRKKHLLEELEAMIMPGDKINAEEVKDSESSGGNSAMIKVSDVKMINCQEAQKSVKDGGQDVHRLKRIDGSARCSFEVELVDETALIGSVVFPKIGFGNGKKMDFINPAKHTKRQGNNLAKDIDEKKVKRSRRRAKGVKTLMETDGKAKSVTQVAESHVGGPKNGERTKMEYTREEMEALRFVNIVEQRKMWKDIYIGLGPAVSKEYDDLSSSKHQKNIPFNCGSSKRFGKKEEFPGFLRDTCTGNTYIELGNLMTKDENENVSPSDVTCSFNTEDEDGSPALGECSEDDDSDEDYASIQRPAFLVEGEPNFESGPPEDGLEYLRRVRWEAAQIPKIRVAKLDRSKVNKEQSVYMPKIPEIADCPEHLLPLKQWEDGFLAEFSELRLAKENSLNLSISQAVSRLEASNADLQSDVILHGKSYSTRLPGDIVLESFGRIGTEEVQSCQPHDCFSLENTYSQPSVVTGQEINTSQQPENLISKSPTNERSSSCPLLSVILGMDSVARVSTLRKRIKSLEDASTLSRSDCLWLFALCAVVDTPLNADTCASLRDLLRKCASLRAGKSELDDEVIMLNILVTISGRYFGQAEKKQT